MVGCGYPFASGKNLPGWFGVKRRVGQQVRNCTIGALVVALVGVLSLPALQQLDQGSELGILFRLRDTRNTPPGVAVVAINRQVSERLGLPLEPDRWPRRVHGELVSALTDAGVTGIVFDLAFERPSENAADDEAFAAAMRRSGRVILCGRLEVDVVDVPDGDGKPVKARVERLRPPQPILRKAAAGLAPFPLPKIPVTVDRYWTFKTGAGNLPTLPVLALHLRADSTFRQLAGTAASFLPGGDREAAPSGAVAEMQDTVRSIRECFEANPSIARQIGMLAGLAGSGSDPTVKREMDAFLDLYAGPTSRHLNLYGPPGTIMTIPFDSIVHRGAGTATNSLPGLRGCVVFVGVSDTEASGMRDGFHTAFSQASGVDLAGVELAATAFANLVDGTAVRQAPFLAQVLLVALWGVLVGAACRALPAPIAGAAVLALGAGYFFWAGHVFSSAALWVPVFVPLAVQAPVGFFGIVWWKYIEAQRTRKRMETSARRYLPDHVVERLAHEYVAGAHAQVAYGACLYSDVARYTALSERMNPGALAELMNRYYEAVLEPIQAHGGRVSHIAGDSVLAVWLAGEDNAAAERDACRAGLAMAAAVNRFNERKGHEPLHTRIGLHAGEMGLGEIGARQRVTYTAVGDIVNTAARIQDLNRHLGTSVLVSKEGLAGCGEFLTRGVGTFLLAGKTTPIEVHELMCRENDADSTARTVCALFAHGMDAYRSRSWDEAIEAFLAVRQVAPGDGPSVFYLSECRRMQANPPGAEWVGVVRFAGK